MLRNSLAVAARLHRPSELAWAWAFGWAGVGCKVSGLEFIGFRV